MLNVALAPVLAGDDDGQAVFFAQPVADPAYLVIASLVGMVVLQFATPKMAIYKGKSEKKNAATTIGYGVQIFIRKSIFFAFNFRHFFCGSCHDAESGIAHIVKKCIKLAALRGLLSFIIREEKLIHRYIVTGNKLIENLEARMLPFILDIGKIARRNVHLIAYLLATFFAFFTSRLNCCPKRFEVKFWYR